MSVEAISWALNLAPVPADRGGQPSSACKFVLVGLANHAGPDGDRRPQGWDLSQSLVRDDLDDAAVAILEHQFPGLGSRLAAGPQLGADGRSGGVQSPHPVTTASEAVDNRPSEVQHLHPGPGSGCNQRADGVQLAQSRGAVVAPEPYREPSREPAAPARKAPHAAGAAGGGPIDEFFATLGPDWRLTAAQRARLTPAVATALNTGWTPRGLAAFAGANTSGVRNPYAVLAARLSPTELPLHTPTPFRPAWCGECEERTRMLGFDGDAPRPCPRCKQTAVVSQASHAENGRFGLCLPRSRRACPSLSCGLV